MIGLYKRDYFKLEPEEIEEKEKIDSERSSENKFGKISNFRRYPAAIRHNQSLFPNNYMDIVNLKNEEMISKQCEDFLALLNDKSITELDIKHFIQNNEYYHIPASIMKDSGYSFGHHDAFVFKEFSLGTSYVADYVLVGLSSDGYKFIFVEFENPYNNVTTKNGEFGTTIRKGLSQVDDWKRFIESNYFSIGTEFKKYTKNNLPDEFFIYDSTRINYVVVAGRRADFKEKTYMLKRELEQDKNIKLYHYDNLYDISVNAIGSSTY